MWGHGPLVPHKYATMWGHGPLVPHKYAVVKNVVLAYLKFTDTLFYRTCEDAQRSSEEDTD